MNRTIVRFQAAGESLFFSLEAPRINVPGVDPGGLHPLTCKVDTAPFNLLAANDMPAGTITQIGQALYDQLAENPEVKEALKQAFTQGTTKPPAPIYLKIGTFITHPDALPWEALHVAAENQFLALDEGWPIGRIANVGPGSAPQERTFDPPLRLLAVIGAAEVAGEPEWDALYREVQTFRADQPQLGAKIHALIAEPTLLTKLKDVQRNDPDLEIESLSDSNLSKAIKSFRPHLIHFFCHGTVVGTTPTLQVATKNFVEGGDEDDLLKLTEDDFRNFARSNPSAWMVMLNCCLAASANAATRSLVAGCVKGGFPAAIGMREPVRSNDAHDFCRFFYRSMFDKLGDVLTDQRDRLEVEWAPLLAEARRQLCKKRGGGLLTEAGNHKEWILPVLYVRPELFILIGPFINPALSVEEVARLQAEILELQNHRPTLVADNAPAEALDELDARVDELRAQLLPPND